MTFSELKSGQVKLIICLQVGPNPNSILNKAQRSALVTSLMICCGFILCWSTNEITFFLNFVGYSVDFGGWFYHFHCMSSVGFRETQFSFDVSFCTSYFRQVLPLHSYSRIAFPSSSAGCNIWRLCEHVPGSYSTILPEVWRVFSGSTTSLWYWYWATAASILSSTPSSTTSSSKESDACYRKWNWTNSSRKFPPLPDAKETSCTIAIHPGKIEAQMRTNYIDLTRN